MNDVENRGGVLADARQIIDTARANAVRSVAGKAIRHELSYKKVLGYLCLFALASLGALADTWTDPETGIAWTYTIHDGQAALGTGFWNSCAIPTSTTGAIEIPSTLGGYPVSSIGSYAFYDCRGLTSVTIPSSVTSIGYRAFSSCRRLASMTIPEYVENIGDGAFAGCCKLQSFVVDDDNQNYKSVNGLLVTKDGKELIAGVNRGDVAIPDGVKRIGFGVFEDCSELTNLSIPLSVTSIGDLAFSCCSGLGNGVVIVDGCVLTVNGDCPDSVVLPEGTRLIAGSAFYNCELLTSIVFPSSVTSIGDYAFWACSELSDITIPSSVNRIGVGAFEGCEKLASVTISQGIRCVDESAFAGCYGLTEVVIPSSVNSIGVDAFGGCENLALATISEGVTSIGAEAFSECYGLTEVTIPPSVTNIGERAFCDCSNLRRVNIPASVTRVGEYAFEGCSAITDATVPGWRCGIDFSSVTNLVIADGTSSIGEEAFYNCWELQSVTIPSGVTCIGNASFSGCGMLSNVTIPPSVTNIGNEAFQSCGLKSVNIPPSVVNIGEWAFCGCDPLASVVLSEGVRNIGNNAFRDCSALTSLVIPSSVTNIDWQAFLGCAKLVSVTISSGVENIGDLAFSGCRLSSVTIPATVVHLGEWVFDDCGLQTIAFEGEPPMGLETAGFRSSLLLYYTVQHADAWKTLIDQCGFANTKCYIPSAIDLKCEIEDASIVITGAKSAATGHLDIPESVAGLPVRRISAQAFQSCKGLASVSIPSSVTNIGAYAFLDCIGLTNLIMADGLTSIGYDAFGSCTGLTSVEIPSSVKCIETYAFSRCAALTSVKIATGATGISSYTFYGCPISDVTASPSMRGLFWDGSSVTNWVVSDGVESIGYSAFSGCGALMSVTIPNGVTNIGAYAFYGSKVTSVTIPSSMKSIGKNAFRDCDSLSSVRINDLASWCAIEFADKWSNPLFGGARLEVNGAEVKDLVVPVGVVGIGAYAFVGLTNLTAVTLPSSVTSVDSSSFMGCPNIRHVEFGCLPHLSKYSLVPFGETDWSVESISETNVVYRSNPIGNHQVTKLEFLIPAGKKSLDFSWKYSSRYEYAFLGWALDWDVDYSKFLNYYFNGDGFNLRGDYITGSDYCYGYEDVSILLDGLEHRISFFYLQQQESGRSDCGWVAVPTRHLSSSEMTLADIFPDSYGRIQTLDVAGGVTDSFVAGCRGLTSVMLAEGLTSIGSSAFAGFKALTSVLISSTVTTIGSHAFEGCSSLGTVTLPAGLKRIGAGAFDENVELLWGKPISETEWEDFGLDCIPEAQRAELELHYDEDGFMIWNGWLLDYKNREATEVVVPEGVIGIGHYALSDMEMERLVLPSTLKYIGSQAISYQWGLEELVIPDSVEYIGQGAFEGCSILSSITFGEGLREIDERAFAGCQSLAPSASFSLGLGKIGREAFADCSQLMSISLPVTVTNVASDAFTGCDNLTGVMTPTATAPLSDWFKPIFTQIKDVTVSPGETEICADMFKGCVALESASLPEGITNIEDRAFADCAKLPSVSLPSTLAALGEEAFRNCDALTAVGLPNGVTRIGARAFYDCGALKNVSLSKGLEALPDQVFDQCGNLDSIVVPASVMSFGENVFGSAMKAVYCLGDAPDYDEDVYASTPSTLTTYVNSGTLGWDGIAHSRNLPPNWPVNNANARAIATWSPVRYDVTFDAGDGVFAKPVVAQTYACEQVVGTAYSLPPYNPVRTGYAFDGWWDSESGGARVSPSTGVTLQKAHTLYAHWKQAQTITVRFNANGGTVEPSELAYMADVPYGELPLPTREHFVFVGWFTAPQGGTLVRVSMEAPKADRELFAHWIPAVYQIRFHANNGSGAWVDQGFTYGETVTFRANSFSCSGCTFAGWSTVPGGAAVYGDRHTIANLAAIGNGIIDLYAVWTGNTYAVRFDSNGGVGQMANQTIVLGVEQTLQACGYTRSGYVFLGWALSPSAQIRFADGASVGNLATQQGQTVDLYAVWGIAGQKTVITFDAGEGSVDEASREVETGARFGTLPTPVWSGHAFGGWRDAHGDLVTDDSIVPPGEVRLTADWGISVRIALPFNHGWRYLWRPAGHRIGWLPPLPKQQAPHPGWCFRGWAYDLAGERLVDSEDLVPEVDTELYAIWIPEEEAESVDLPEVEYDEAGLVIWDGWLIDCENRDISALSIPEGVVGIGKDALAEMYNLQTVLFPSTLKEIGEGAFAYDTYLDCVDLPDGVQTIGTNAFAYCTWLQSLAVGTGVTTVASGAFRGCAQLAKAEFSEGLGSVEDEAFADCWRMMSVELPLTVTNVASTAFTGCSSLVGVTVPSGVTPMSVWFSPIYAQIQDVTVPVGETVVCSNMFKGCAALTGVSLPEGLTNIADGAFWNCSKLADIVLPASLVSLGADSFRNCDALTAIGLPDGVECLGARAFYDCAVLADVSLSGGLKELPEQAFDSCAKLDSLTIPAGVTNLGARVFGSALKAAYFVGNAPLFDDNAYAATASGLTTYVKDGSKGWESRSKPKSRFLPETWPSDDNAYARSLATWEPVQYDVAFDAGDGVFYPVATNVYACLQTRGTAYALPPFEPMLAGKKFAGWWTEPEAGTQVTPSAGVKLMQAHTLYAYWTGGTAITARFNACGGVVDEEEVGYTAGVPYGHFPVPTREHHVFVGWFTAASGGERVKESTEVPLADVELFAQWTPSPYRIRFNANNGTGAQIEQSFVYGQTVTLRGNTFACKDCVFAGWSLTPGGAAVYGDRSTIPGLAAIQDGVIDLYAVWSGSVYAVRFDSHGGTGTMPNQTFVLGIAQSLAACSFVREGYVFAGWARSTDGAMAYADGESVVNVTGVRNATVVLFAVWERDPSLEWTIEEYLHCSNLTFALGGDSPYWYGLKAARAGKKGMMRSGAISSSQTNWIETVVNGTGTISFWWKASSECQLDKNGKVIGLYDYAEFTIDGVSVAEIGGESGWTVVTQSVESAGTHTLRWMYHKDESGSDGEDCAWIDSVAWTPSAAPNPIPDLGENPTARQVEEALEGSADARLAVCITNAANYNAYRDWAANVKTPDGNGKAGAQTVKESSNAWFSFAVGSDKLISELPTSEDIKVDEFIPSSESGKFDFMVSIEGVTVGEEALKENLKQVFGLEGSTSLDPNGFSSDNVDIDFDTPKDGKVKFTAGPKQGNGNTESFFMKVKVNP